VLFIKSKTALKKLKFMKNASMNVKIKTSIRFMFSVDQQRSLI
jgi:hypothetical protein